MFDKLEDLLGRFEEILGELHDPGVTDNQERFRRLMKEQSDLTPIVEAYTEYKKCRQDIEDSLTMLEEESDEEMREMIKETLADSKKRMEELAYLKVQPRDYEENRLVLLRAERMYEEALGDRRKKLDHYITVFETALKKGDHDGIRRAREELNDILAEEDE